MEARGVRIEQLRAGIDEALALIEASREPTLLEALRKLSGSVPNPLRTYVLGEELVVAVGSYSLLSVSVGEGKVRAWEDWRERFTAAAKDTARSVAKKLMTVILDKGEDLPSSVREEMGRLAAALEKADAEELQKLLKQLRESLQVIACG